MKYQFSFPQQRLSERILLWSTERDMIKNIWRSSCNGRAILLRFSWKLNFLPRFFKNNQISNFIPSSGSRVLCGRTDRLKRPIVAFLNFANGPKNWSNSMHIKWSKNFACNQLTLQHVSAALTTTFIREVHLYEPKHSLQLYKKYFE